MSSQYIVSFFTITQKRCAGNQRRYSFIALNTIDVIFECIFFPRKYNDSLLFPTTRFYQEDEVISNLMLYFCHTLQ
jgi:hypothetical protein